MHKVVHSAAKIIQEALSLSTPRGRLIAINALFSVLAVLGPKRLEGGPSLCLFRLATGKPCPACGMTRAVSALLRGKVGLAVSYNLLSLPAFLTILVVLADDLCKVMFAKPLIQKLSYSKIIRRIKKRY